MKNVAYQLRKRLHKELTAKMCGQEYCDCSRCYSKALKDADVFFDKEILKNVKDPKMVMTIRAVKLFCTAGFFDLDHH